MWVTAPVDFSSLDSEYIGILYEGLLDFELRTAPSDQPIVFLGIGHQPALPLARLEAMDDRTIKQMIEKLKDTSSDEEGESQDSVAERTEEEEETAADSENETEDEQEPEEDTEEQADTLQDLRHTMRARAEAWARRACGVGKLVKKPRGNMTPEKRRRHEADLDRKARQIVPRVVLPGEWYLVRWGGTRKGSGTFYTRPQLAVPTVHRTLRPLAYIPPTNADGQPDEYAPLEVWTPKPPEEILALKVCDPACGSGSFPLAALRFLTEALYRSLHHYDRVRGNGGQAVIDLIHDQDGEQSLASEALPCRPDDEGFELRTKALLRRYIVERCIYGVDLDPLAVELCRLSLWIETLNPRLPFTFLEHKIRPGNSLVGAWFDQFLHYPAMAWEREGGDKNHSGGVHFKKEAWTKAIKECKKAVKKDLIDFIDGGSLLYKADLSTVQTVHDDAERALQEIHSLGIHEAAERAERYRRLREGEPFRNLQEAFDLWCALWFWPPEQLEASPLPLDFAEENVSDEARAVVRELAARHRFFHWELEFPDVFGRERTGFDAVFGNPPWDIAKPNSKEFFSAVDPIYRGYGKQEALDKQKEHFETDREIERRWLEYNAGFRGLSNWMKYAGHPFGDRVTYDSKRKPKHDFSLGTGGVHSFRHSRDRHDRWRQKREESTGYADEEHPFRHQGAGDINLYKMFLEQAHALLGENGRLGMIVPSGLYSDHGTGDLRRLFVDRSRWEWLFGFENREGIFNIHRSYKFNPVIVAKGRQTAAIRTAFMRRNLADWEHGEDFVTEYPREQIVQFSPHSRAILEIQSRRDLEVLTKIYSNSVLLGDQGPNGWGIKYATEFHMTNDSKLFPPRPKWEEWGYRPDEYSRWIKGPWKPIEQLYDELSVDPYQPMPIDRDRARHIKQGIARGEVAATDCRVRCAQPPYDRLPIPRADIPEGILLSREATHYLHEDEIPEVTFTDASGRPLKIKGENEEGEKEEIEVTGPAIALPLYQGVMVGAFDPTKAAWLSGTGLNARWERIPWYAKVFNSQFLVAFPLYQLWSKGIHGFKVGFRDIARTTDTRTMICCLVPDLPCGNKVPTLKGVVGAPAVQSILNSLPYDWAHRVRQGATSINYFILEEAPLPTIRNLIGVRDILGSRLGAPLQNYAPLWSRDHHTKAWKRLWALTDLQRISLRCMVDAIVAAIFGLTSQEVIRVLNECDYPISTLHDTRFTSTLHPKGFWRVDKDRHPEHRHTVLTLIAFHDLQEKIADCGGDVAQGIEAFCNQNDGEGWMLPETLRLADYDLGHDERAKQHQPVRECFGPRFYDWQLAQDAEESWRECHLHARNLLGPDGYQALLDDLKGKEPEPPEAPRHDGEPRKDRRGQFMMFETEEHPLFDKK